MSFLSRLWSLAHKSDGRPTQMMPRNLPLETLYRRWRINFYQIHTLLSSLVPQSQGYSCPALAGGIRRTGAPYSFPCPLFGEGFPLYIHPVSKSKLQDDSLVRVLPNVTARQSEMQCRLRWRSLTSAGIPRGHADAVLIDKDDGWWEAPCFNVG